MTNDESNLNGSIQVKCEGNCMKKAFYIGAWMLGAVWVSAGFGQEAATTTPAMAPATATGTAPARGGTARGTAAVTRGGGRGGRGGGGGTGGFGGGGIATGTFGGASGASTVAMSPTVT